MTKDEIVKLAKENFNVSLNPKDKLADLELQLKSLENANPVVEDEEVVESDGRTPLFSKGEHGKIVPWNPRHREEFWTFIYDERALTSEERKSLGL
jgi:hypothetical protein